MFKTKFNNFDSSFNSNFSDYNIIRGEDGFSPEVSVVEVENGHQVDITDKKGTVSFIVADGTDGIDGKDGHTPIKGTDYFDGIDGVGIEEIYFNDSDEMIVSMTDGSTKNLGKVVEGVNLEKGNAPGSTQQKAYTTEAGTVLGAIASGEGATAFGGQRYDKAGTDVTEEPQTEARGIQSFAVGAGTLADGTWSVAIGRDTSAYQRASFAAGGGSKAGLTFAEWLLENSLEDTEENKAKYETTYGYSMALGERAVATGKAAVAIGNRTEATGTYSFATGQITEASGLDSATFGNDTKATGAKSFAAGEGSVAEGERAFAIGKATTASGESAVSEGDGTSATNWAAHASGIGTIASGKASSSCGASTKASGYASFVSGIGTTAEGDFSTAEGNNTLASGYNSHAGGHNSEAKGDNSFAHGDGVLADGQNTAAFGSFNKVPDTVDESNPIIFYLGNGDSEGSRSNAVTITKKGESTFASDMAVKGSIEANSITITNPYYTPTNPTDVLCKKDAATYLKDGKKLEDGRDSFSVHGGFNSKVEGINTFAFGDTAHAGYDNSIALGKQTLAKGYSSAAIGWGAKAESTGQVAVGRFNDKKDGSYFIVGNGTSDEARSNALVVNSNGTAWFAGNITIGNEENNEVVTIAALNGILDTRLGDIETLLDGIIEIQNDLIGGES